MAMATPEDTRPQRPLDADSIRVLRSLTWEQIARTYPEGTRVIVVEPGGVALNVRDIAMVAGMIGTVRITASDNRHYLGIEFDSFDSGHQLGGLLARGSRSGYNLYPWEVRVTDATMPVTPWEAVPAVPAPAAQTPRRLRVEIRRDDAIGAWILHIENGPDPESIYGSQLRPYIPKEYHRFIARKFQWDRSLLRFVDIAVNGGIPPEVLVDAIRSCCIAIQKRERQGTFSSEQGLSDDYLRLIDDITSEPPLIAIGDKLFSLTPRGVVSGARGLEMLRKRVLQKSKESAVRMLDAAKEEGRVIISTAEQRAAEAMIKVEDERRQMKLDASSGLPEWIRSSSVTVAFSGGTYPWRIAIWVSTKVDRFECMSPDGQRVYQWEAATIVGRSPAKVMLWLPINPFTGEFQYGGTSKGCTVAYAGRADGGISMLPHITTGGCCMELQGMPPAIKNVDDLNKVTAIINRGMKVVNLSSLLASFGSWHKDVVDQTPEPVRQHINHNIMWDDLVRVSTGHVDVASEAQELFTTSSMPSIIQRAAQRAIAEQIAAAPPGLVIDPTPAEDDDSTETPVFRVRE